MDKFHSNEKLNFFLHNFMQMNVPQGSDSLQYGLRHE